MDSYVFFDVDGVLINGQSQRYLLRYLFKKKRIKAFLFLKLAAWFFIYKIGLCNNPEKIRKSAYSNFKGWEIDQAKRLFKDFFQKEIKPRLNKEIIAILKNHLEKEEKVVLISAGLKEIVGILADYLGVKYCLAAELEEERGKYTGNLSRSAPYGEGKVEAIKDFFGSDKDVFADSWVYADHYSDLPLLEKAKNSCVVNPGRKLYRYAKKRGWKAYRF